MSNVLEDIRLQYLELGYDSIPLRPMTKQPIMKSWQRVDPMKQWQKAEPKSNIGLLAGNGKAFIDCDDKNQAGTFDTVVRWLDGLGYKDGGYPVVKTPSGGKHVYVNFTGTLLGSNQLLSHQIGAGEFKFDCGAMVAAPPSVTDVGRYEMVEGDLFNVPVLDMNDIATLINVQENQSRDSSKPATVSRLASDLMQGKEVLRNGKPRYGSRSEADGALILSLINTGNTYEQIKRIFEDFPTSGRYHELQAQSPKQAENYLYLTYKEMLKYSNSHVSPVRQAIENLQNLANHYAWKNVTDKNVLLAHLELAYKSGKYVYNAGVRDLAAIAGIETMAASRATKRLLTNEMLKLEIVSDKVHSAKYSLQVDRTIQSLSTPSVRDCIEKSTQQYPTWKGERISTHDAFRNGVKNKRVGYLGQRAGEIYELLYPPAPPLTLKEIVERTNAHQKTVKRALKKLSFVVNPKTGEIFEMVKFDGERYSSEVIDLDYIAVFYERYGARAKQIRRYARERKDYKRELDKGKLKSGNEN